MFRALMFGILVWQRLTIGTFSSTTGIRGYIADAPSMIFTKFGLNFCSNKFKMISQCTDSFATNLDCIP